jgi:HEAT repeat protein
MKKTLLMLVLVAFPLSFALAQDQKSDAKKPEKEKTVQEYIKDLDSSNEDAVVEAEKKIGEKKEESATAKLLILCKGDKRDRVRMYAAVALGIIADKKTAEPLSGMVLNELNADVRYAQVLAISRIGADEAPKKITDNLAAAGSKESDPFIKDFLVKMEEKFKGK